MVTSNRKKVIFFIASLLFLSIFLFLSIDRYNFNEVSFVYYKDFKPGYSCEYNLNQIDFFDYDEKFKYNDLSRVRLNILQNFQNYNCINKITHIDDGWPQVRIGIGDDVLIFQLIKSVGLILIFIFFINFYTKKDLIYLISSIFYNLLVYLLYSFDFKFPEEKYLYSYEIFFVEIVILYLIYLHFSENQKLEQIFNYLEIFFHNLSTKSILFFSTLIGIRTVYVFFTNTYAINIPDWLINYNFGFVRRGLAGALLLEFSNDLSFISYKLLPVILFTIHFFITFFALKIFQENNKNIYSVFLLLSPIFILFPTYNVSKSAGNKEGLGLLILLIVIRSTYKKVDTRIWLILSVLVGISLFSHEVNIFIFLSILLGYLILKLKIKKLFIFSIFLFSVMLILLIFLVPADGDVAEQLCKNTFLQIENIDCSKSYWLQQNFSDSINFSISRIFQDIDYLVVYGTYFVISILPLLLSGWLRNNKKLFLLTLLTFGPLFMAAIDWGRWINLIIFSFTLFYFVTLNKKDNFIVFNLKNLILLIFYSTLWRVPQCCVEEINIVYLFRFDKFNF